ncbi:hypothetical protein ACJIZ3_002012 [Penstemon smallii]|uniref:Uncharacterized protein n=1 Tax=Penstemon smallii TaxID=265156 RepID=A0ABD3U5A6_9LAMI
MGLRPRISAVKRAKRKSSNLNRRLNKPQSCHRNATHIRAAAAATSVSDKLETLKNLIPSHKPETKPEQLFQETADYIVLLKTQVLVLQKLIDFYGSSQNQDNSNSV